MVVCHCLAVNDHLIAEIIQTYSPSVEDVMNICGAGTCCGGCVDSIEGVISNVVREKSVSIR